MRHGSAFVERRFDPTRSDGLIVTLLVIAAIYAASLAAGLVEELMEVQGSKRSTSGCSR